MDLSAYLDLFVAEAREHLGAAHQLASSVDDRPAEESLRDLFRHVHSLKGMAASMGFGAMSGLAHDAESLMDQLRSGLLRPQPSTRRLLCDTLSCLERMVDRAARKEDVDDHERPPLQEGLRRMHGIALGGLVLEPLPETGGTARPVTPADPQRANAPAGCVNVALIVRRDRAFPAVRAAVVLGRLAKAGTIVRTDPAMAALRTGRFDGRLLVTLVSSLPLRALAAQIAAIDEIDTFTLVPADSRPERVAPAAPKATLRVRADRIDALIEDILELMVSLGRVHAGAGREPGSPPSRDAESARLLARHAYDTLVEMRLVPFEVATQRLLRDADELSRRLGKTVSLEVEGQDVRIDRSLLERLLDPLLHMVRNAIDHGLEAPERRRAARKPPSGRVRVRLVRQASRLTLLVEDDGRGLDPRRLKQVAIERGFKSPSEAVRASDAEALQWITLPGFTTMETSTEVSGRGVGMDIVKSTIEALGGRLHIDSELGGGTRFEIALPSAVALVQTYLVRAGGATFAIPLTAIGRMAAMDDHSTTWRGGRRFWSVGSDEIPVTALRELLGLGGEPPARGGMALLADTPRGETIGIEVDEILGRREVIVRPLPAPLSGLPGYAGASILDDGSIVLVLDPVDLPKG